MVDRPAPDCGEIEVTPEMIEAGAAELADYDERFEFREDAVMRIFLAMCDARTVSPMPEDSQDLGERR